MKVNFFLLFIAIILCGLTFFGFYKWTDGNALYTWVSSVAGLLFLIPACALSITDYPRSTLMMKTFSATIFVIVLVANILFARYEVSDTAFVITNGALFCIWAAVSYGISTARQ